MQDETDPSAQNCAAEVVKRLADCAKLGEVLADASLPAMVELLEVSD